MGFFSNLFGKKEDENKREPDFKNLQKDDTVQFNKFYDALMSDYSDKFMKITGSQNIKDASNWFDLEYGELYLKNDGKKVELIKQFENTDDFIDNVDMDVVNELLNLDDDEVLDGEIISKDRDIPVTSAVGFMQEGMYKVQKDVFTTLNGEEIRYVEAKTSDSSSYIYLIVKPQGETLIYASTTQNVSDFTFF